MEIRKLGRASVRVSKRPSSLSQKEERRSSFGWPGTYLKNPQAPLVLRVAAKRDESHRWKQVTKFQHQIYPYLECTASKTSTHKSDVGCMQPGRSRLTSLFPPNTIAASRENWRVPYGSSTRGSGCRIVRMPADRARYGEWRPRCWPTARRRSLRILPLVDGTDPLDVAASRRAAESRIHRAVACLPRAQTHCAGDGRPRGAVERARRSTTSPSTTRPCCPPRAPESPTDDAGRARPMPAMRRLSRSCFHGTDAGVHGSPGRKRGDHVVVAVDARRHQAAREC